MPSTICPGSQDFANTILPFVHKSSVIILANHGTVSFGETVEKAYWATEILDAYCRMLILAKSLGKVNYFSESEAKALLDLKTQWGMKDPRVEIQNCELCANDVFRESWKESGVERCAFQPPIYHPERQAGSTTSQEDLIQAITDRVMAALKGGRAVSSQPLQRSAVSDRRRIRSRARRSEA